jgi:hypothetical protein
MGVFGVLELNINAPQVNEVKPKVNAKIRFDCRTMSPPSLCVCIQESKHA